MSDLASLERRIRALENNRGASFRFGVVSSVDEKTGTARVQLPDGEGLVSQPLRVSQRRTLKDQSQELPDVGEHVACIFSGQGFEEGAVLGAVYSKLDASPGRPSHSWYMKFADGTEIEYDRQSHHLSAKVKGTADIEADKDVKVSTQTVMTLAAKQQITLATPKLAIGGFTGGSCKATVEADWSHVGDNEHVGDYKQTGDYTQTGNHDLSGSVNAGGTVIDAAGNTNHHSHG